MSAVVLVSVRRKSTNLKSNKRRGYRQLPAAWWYALEWRVSAHPREGIQNTEAFSRRWS